MIFNNLPIPKYCQTCGIEKNNNDENMNENDEECHYAFCSVNCYNIASITHYGGAILAVQFFQGDPCIILIKDKSRKNYISELPGGRKKSKEGSGKTSARETTEEIGLKNPISYTYLENKGVRLVSWFKKNNNNPNFNPKHNSNSNLINISTTNNTINTIDYYNYTTYVISMMNFDIINANLAVKSRLCDDELQDEWKETECIYLVPIRNLENFINHKSNMILDYKDQPIPPLSTKWTSLLYNMDTIRIMKELVYSDIAPWNVKVKNMNYEDVFVWDHTDLIEKA